MRLKPVWIDLVLLSAVIPLVVFIFRWVPERLVAATIAGCLFVGVPLVLMIRRWRVPLAVSGAGRLWWAGVLQFWFLFALPILGKRLLNWGVPFEEFTFFGVPGAQWHQLSNKSYLLMLVAILVAGVWASSTQNKKAGQ